MRRKKTLLLVVLTFLFAAIVATPVPVKAADETRLYIRESPPPDGYIPGKPVGQYLWVTVDIEIPMAWDYTPDGIVGYTLDVCVNPDVLEPIYVYFGSPGYYLRDFCDYWGIPPPPPRIQPEPTDGCFLGITEFLMGWETLGVGAGGPSGDPAWGYGLTGGLLQIRYKSKSETAHTVIDISNAYYWTADGTKHAFDVVDDGHYNQPSPPPVPEFPLGAEAVAGIGLMAAIAYIWTRRRKTRSTITKRFAVPTSQ